MEEPEKPDDVSVQARPTKPEQPDRAQPRVTELRVGRHWDQATLAARAGLSVELIQRHEAGTDSQITIDDLEDITNPVGVEPRQLLLRRNDRVQKIAYVAVPNIVSRR